MTNGESKQEVKEVAVEDSNARKFNFAKKQAGDLEQAGKWKLASSAWADAGKLASTQADRKEAAGCAAAAMVRAKEEEKKENEKPAALVFAGDRPSLHRGFVPVTKAVSWKQLDPKTKEQDVPKKTRNKDRVSPEEFVEMWQGAKSSAELAEALGKNPRALTQRASHYRSLGIALKKFPRGHTRVLDVEGLKKLAKKTA